MVDGDKDIVEATTNLMEIFGIDVVGVGYDGKQAVELRTKHNPDFLILDLSMSKFDGFFPFKQLQGLEPKH